MSHCIYNSMVVQQGYYASGFMDDTSEHRLRSRGARERIRNGAKRGHDEMQVQLHPNTSTPSTTLPQSDDAAIKSFSVVS